MNLQMVQHLLPEHVFCKGVDVIRFAIVRAQQYLYLLPRSFNCVRVSPSLAHELDGVIYSEVGISFLMQ